MRQPPARELRAVVFDLDNTLLRSSRRATRTPHCRRADLGRTEEERPPLRPAEPVQAAPTDRPRNAEEKIPLQQRRLVEDPATQARLRHSFSLDTSCNTPLLGCLCSE